MTGREARTEAPRLPDRVLAWYFVLMWGSGFLATKAGLHYAAPFTFLTLRFGFGIVCMLVLVSVARPRWPAGREHSRTSSSPGC